MTVQETIPIADVAKMLGVNVVSVGRWIATGTKLKDGSRLKLAGVKLPGGWRTTPGAVDEFVKALTDDGQRD